MSTGTAATMTRPMPPVGAFERSLGSWRILQHPFDLGLLALLVAVLAIAGMVEAIPAAIVTLPVVAAAVLVCRGSPRKLLVFWSGLLFMEALATANLAIKMLMVIVIALTFVKDESRHRGGMSDEVGNNRIGGWIVAALVCMSLLTAWIVLSITWAVSAERVIAALEIWFPLIVFFGVILYRPPSVQLIRELSAALIFSAVFSILLGMLFGGTFTAVAPEQGRLEGAAGDPNFLAAGLPLIIALCGFWFGNRRDVITRILVVGALAIVLMGLVLTGSRGGILAAIVMGATILIIEPRHRGRRIFLSLLVVVVASLLILVLPTGRRILEASGGTGREELWAIAIELTEERPVLGVGFDNFPLIAHTKVREVGELTEVDLIVNRPHQVHNLYLQVLSELGAVGLLLYLGFASACILAGLAASRRFAARGDMQTAGLVNAFVAGLVAMLTATAFLPLIYDKRLWLMYTVALIFTRLVAHPEAVSRRRSSSFRQGTEPPTVLASTAGSSSPRVGTDATVGYSERDHVGLLRF